MSYCIRYNKGFNEWEVIDQFGGDFVASFKAKHHASTWCELMNGQAYIVQKKPPEIKGES